MGRQVPATITGDNSVLDMKLDGVVVSKVFSLSGGNLPKDKSYSLTMKCRLDGVTVRDIIAGHGAKSMVIDAQKIRDWKTTVEIESLKGTYNVTIQELGVKVTERTPASLLRDAVAAGIFTEDEAKAKAKSLGIEY